MLKNTILKFLNLEGFVEHLTGYVETRVELFKTEVREDIAKGIARLSLILILTFSFIVFILFASIALALWIGESLGLVWGFAILSGAYLLIAVIFLLFKEPISKNLEKKLLDVVKKN